MTVYSEIEDRLKQGGTVLLDGAIGSELQEMGAPMGGGFWCGRTVENSPDVIRQLHKDYIDIGADIITTNTFDTVPLKIWNDGLGEKAREWNLTAARLAVEARDQASTDRPVVVAGALGPNSQGDPDQIRESFKAQSQYLAEGGVDMLLVEMIGNRRGPRVIACEEALATGLPTWVAFSTRLIEDGRVLLGHPLHATDPRRGEGDPADDPTFADSIEDVKSLGCGAALVFHSEVDHTGAALDILRDAWDGPVGVYPHRGDFKMPEWQFENRISPEEFVDATSAWLGQGAQIVGGCCGIGREHIRQLKQRLEELDAS